MRAWLVRGIAAPSVPLSLLSCAIVALGDTMLPLAVKSEDNPENVMKQFAGGASNFYGRRKLIIFTKAQFDQQDRPAAACPASLWDSGNPTLIVFINFVHILTYN